MTTIERFTKNPEAGPLVWDDVRLPAPVLPVDLSDVDADAPGAAVARLLEASERERVTSMRIDGHVLDEGSALLLEELARVQREQTYVFSFEWAVTPRIGEPEVRALRDAGVRAVTLDAGSLAGEDGFARLGLVRRLTEVGVDVRWHVADAALLETAWPILLHLAPPEPNGTPSPELAAALAQWRRAHGPDQLTYTRGPGFVRILDRRTAALERLDAETPRDTSSSNETVIGLRDLQAEILLACTAPRTGAELTERFAGRASADAIRSFMTTLARKGLVLHSEHDAFLALPLHLKVYGVG